jgi:hypothetical protein
VTFAPEDVGPARSEGHIPAGTIIGSIEPDTELQLLRAVEGGVQVEVVIDGEAYDPAKTLAAKDCPHAEVVNVQTFVAFIQDDAGVVVEWQVRVRARCGSCATQFDIHPNGRRPKDSNVGVVFAMLPLKEE